MDFLFAGAGAVGSSLGGFLKKAGHRVAFLGRAAHMDAIRDAGLRISGLWGNHCVRGIETATGPASLAGPFDAVFLSVKSFDTAEMTRAVRPLLSPETLLISVQNGLGNLEAAAAESGHPHILGGRVIYGSEMTAPGHVHISVYTQPVMIGFPNARKHPRPESAIRKARSVAAALDQAGIPCEYTGEIEKHLWAKLLYNCALNPLGALHRVHYGALGENPAWRGTMDAIVAEIFSVARVKDIPLQWPGIAEYLSLFYSKLLPDTYHHRSSMLQDIERNRRTEIDSMNGIVVRYGDETGVPVPVNAEMVREIRKRGEK